MNLRGLFSSKSCTHVCAQYTESFNNLKKEFEGFKDNVNKNCSQLLSIATNLQEGSLQESLLRKEFCNHVADKLAHYESVINKMREHSLKKPHHNKKFENEK